MILLQDGIVTGMLLAGAIMAAVPLVAIFFYYKLSGKSEGRKRIKPQYTVLQIIGAILLAIIMVPAFLICMIAIREWLNL